MLNISEELERAGMARTKGNAIYAKLLPTLKAKDIPSGHYVLIDVETGDWKSASSRVELLKSYPDEHNKLMWIRRIDYDREPGKGVR